jgi:hypothetical protein
MFIIYTSATAPLINLYYPCYQLHNYRRDLTTGMQDTTAGLLTPHLSAPVDTSFVVRSDVLKDACWWCMSSSLWRWAGSSRSDKGPQYSVRRAALLTLKIKVLRSFETSEILAQRNNVASPNTWILLTSYVICWYKQYKASNCRPVKFQFLSCDNINSVFKQVCVVTQHFLAKYYNNR